MRLIRALALEVACSSAACSFALQRPRTECYRPDEIKPFGVFDNCFYANDLDIAVASVLPQVKVKKESLDFLIELNRETCDEDVCFINQQMFVTLLALVRRLKTKAALAATLHHNIAFNLGVPCCRYLRVLCSPALSIHYVFESGMGALWLAVYLNILGLRVESGDVLVLQRAHEQMRQEYTGKALVVKPSVLVHLTEHQHFKWHMLDHFYRYNVLTTLDMTSCLLDYHTLVYITRLPVQHLRVMLCSSVHIGRLT